LLTAAHRLLEREKSVYRRDAPTLQGSTPYAEKADAFSSPVFPLPEPLS
jgi:hypothetical protein